MGFYKFLATANPNDSEKIFSAYGIKNWKNWNYSKNNLIIGENGAGKSRILKAVREICRKSKIPCIYMDFTQISGDYSKKDNDGRRASILSSPLLFHGSVEPDIYFDFIPRIEEDTEIFSSKLMEMKRNFSTYPVARKRFEKVNEVLNRYLGRSFDLDTDPEKCLLTCREADRPPICIEECLAEMSPGERCILYFSLGMMCFRADEEMNGEYVLLLDEPENHVHPRILRAFIRDIKEALPDVCKMMIATHSVFLVPAFDFEEIIHVQNGEISRATGSLYPKLYGELVGEDPPDDQENLHTFFASLDSWGYAEYLAECLAEEPTVRDDPNDKDPQFQKMNAVFWPSVEKWRENNSPVYVLDYGGGSGRIAKCLELYLKNNDLSLDNKLIYDVYDKNPQPEKISEAAWMGSYFGKVGKLSEKRYDFILLMNVLHEIDVTEWADSLNGILSLAKETGTIIFGERAVLSRGERPFGKSGYLVLDENELKCLFGNDAVTEITVFREGKDPTVSYSITVSKAHKVEQSDVIAAVEALYRRMSSHVNKYIDRAVKTPNGRDYAFSCQGKINAEHARILLNSMPSPAKYPKETLNGLINEYSGEELVKRVTERAKYDDGEGKKCANWLANLKG